MERRGARSTSKYRGVTHHCRTGRWEAHLWQHGKQVYLGGFSDEPQAALAYDIAAIKARGRVCSCSRLAFLVAACVSCLSRHPANRTRSRTSPLKTMARSWPTWSGCAPFAAALHIFIVFADAAAPQISQEELVLSLRRQSKGFTRGTSRCVHTGRATCKHVPHACA